MEITKDKISYILDEYQQRLLNYFDDNDINDDDLITSLEEKIESHRDAIDSIEGLKALFQEIGTVIKEQYQTDELFISDDILKNMLDSLE